MEGDDECEVKAKGGRFGRLPVLELLAVLDFLDVRSLVRLGQCSRTFYLPCLDIRERHPHVATTSLSSMASLPALIDQAQSAPTCVIIFDSKLTKYKERDLKAACLRFPPETCFLYAETGYVEAGGNGKTITLVSSMSRIKARGAESTNAAPSFSVQMCAFPGAIATAFLLNEGALYSEAYLARRAQRSEEYYEDDDEEDSRDMWKDDEQWRGVLAEAGMDDPSADWSVFILCVVGFNSNTDNFPSSLPEGLQRLYPRAAIFGGLTGGRCGVATKGVVKMSQARPSTSEVSILAFRGNVPIHVVVSRGVEAVSPVYDLTTERGDDDFALIARFAQPSSDSASSAPPPAALKFQGVFESLIPTLRQRRMSAHNIILGISTNREGPFTLKTGRVHRSGSGDLVVGLDQDEDTPLHGCFFVLTPKACALDVKTSLAQASQRLASRGERAVSCVLFSCSARGPSAGGFFETDSYDASTFCEAFPTTSLIGCYCGGEIGPAAMAQSSSETVFRADKAQLQGFTGVFGIFALESTRKAPKTLLQKLKNEDASLVDNVSALLAAKRNL